MRNVADLLAATAERRPEEMAVIDTAAATSLTWSELDAAVNGQAKALIGLGVEPGARVVLRLPTSADFVIGLFAVTRIGAIAVPLSPLAPRPELTRVAERSGARLVLSRDAEEGQPPVTEPGEALPSVRGDEDIALISFTSGTTGPVRGVMLSHRALLANVEQIASVQDMPRESDRVFLPIPLCHAYGLGPGMLQSTAVGATMVLAESFEVAEGLELCARHRVTVFSGVPAMYTDLAQQPAGVLTEALATVRLLSSGAAPLHPKVLATMREKTGLAVFEGYGLTETAPMVTSTLVTGYAKPGSVGRPLPGVELRLVSSDGGVAPVPLDPDDLDDTFDEDATATGLVAIRGRNLFSGYWPDGRDGPDEEGWFRTGDIGYLDTDGDLHLVDRANDLIIVNGFNVYPHEVEDVISRLPGVAEVAVVGVVDERSGEAVKAVVVPAEGAALSEQQVSDQCAANLAGYKVPHLVEFVSTLPHSATGKLRRLKLR